MTLKSKCPYQEWECQFDGVGSRASQLVLHFADKATKRNASMGKFSRGR